MKCSELQLLEARWRGYVDRFRVAGGLHPMHQLKLEHSLRVAADARIIALDSGWDAGEVNLAEAVGVLHDIARFSQLEKYGTFSDAESIDHGDLGAQTLEQEQFLEELDAELRALILHAVRYHNKKELPRTLTAREERLLRLIRDADRLDIFFVSWESVRSGQIHDHPELIMNTDFNGPPTAAVLDQFERGEAIDYRGLKTMADRFVIQLSWMHDLSYAASRRLVRERKMLEKLLEVLPVKTARLTRCFEQTMQLLAEA